MSTDLNNVPPHLRARARGAVSNRSGRFETTQRAGFDDGWEMSEDEQRLDTVVRREQAKSIVTKNAPPDISFERSINPYRGCEHGCIYCFARPTHAYLGLSPGLDFETQLTAKTNAAQLLKSAFERKGYTPKPIALGTNTDPYQPIEKRFRIMRGILEVMRDYRHPVTIVTKGAIITRDIDILTDLAHDNLVHVGVSITSMDPVLSRLMEPRAPSPPMRLRAVAQLSAAGIPVRAMVAPVVPMLTDHEIEAILSGAKKAGAAAAGWIMLRLPAEVSPIFKEWLETRFPDRAARIMNRVREMHDGKDYSAQWGRRMRGEGPYADLIRRRFDVTTKRLGLNRSLPDLNTTSFAVPGRGQQLALF